MQQPNAPKIDLDCDTPENSVGYYADEQSIINPSRKDHFLFVMDLPPALKGAILDDNRVCREGSFERLEFNIWGTVIPDISITVLEVPYSGQTWAWSGYERPTYGAINCNFTVDNRYDNYYILWKWLNIQNDSSTGEHVNSISDYTTTISIYPLDENKKPITEFIFRDAFVSSIGSITKSTRDPAETETTFSFVFSQLDMRLI